MRINKKLTIIVNYAWCWGVIIMCVGGAALSYIVLNYFNVNLYLNIAISFVVTTFAGSAFGEWGPNLIMYIISLWLGKNKVILSKAKAIIVYK